MRSLRKYVAVLASALVVGALAAGCAQPDLEEEEGTSSQAATASVCPDYPTNPACDSELFLIRAWELAKEDPKANVIDAFKNAKSCIQGLVAGGAILVATNGLAAPVILSTARVATGIKSFNACVDFGKYLDRTGLPANISCLLDPVVYSPAVMACKCTEQCKGGVWNTGGVTGEALRERTSFKYGFLDRAGSANCYCTNQLKEARCQSRCTKWASTSATDCKCDSLYDN